MKYKIFWIDKNGEKKEEVVKKDCKRDALLEAFLGYMVDNSHEAPFGILEEITD